jgi:hypothetical protein
VATGIVSSSAAGSRTDADEQLLSGFRSAVIVMPIFAVLGHAAVVVAVVR